MKGQLLLGGARMDCSTAKEEVRGRSVNREKSVCGGGQGWTVCFNKHRTFSQEITVRVQCETRTQW